VWGLIGARWLEIGREAFGYPITDEMTCPDGMGRFNHFRALNLAGTPDSSIYWSPATGAHEIYGAIRGKWASLGWERGPVGYPVEAEHDQAGGGRTQRFQRGVITWTGSGGAAEHEISSDTATFESGPVTSDLPLGGYVHLVVQRNGTFTYSGHAHDSGFDNIEYVMLAVLVTATGTAFKLQHSGHVEGTAAGLPLGTPNRNDDFTDTGRNDQLTHEWDHIVESGKLLTYLSGVDKTQQGLSDLLESAAKAVAAAGIAALVTLI
jgi:hypothetical protein